MKILFGVITIDDVFDEEQKSTAEIQKFGGVEELDYLCQKLSLVKKSRMADHSVLGRNVHHQPAYFDDEISKPLYWFIYSLNYFKSGGSGSEPPL